MPDQDTNTQSITGSGVSPKDLISRSFGAEPVPFSNSQPSIEDTASFVVPEASMSSKPSRTLVAVLFMVLLAACVILLLSFRDQSSSAKKPSAAISPSSPAAESDADLARDKSAVLNLAIFHFPDISSGTATIKTQLPDAIQIFIYSQAANVSIQRVTFKNQQSGFSFSYSISNQPMFTVLSAQTALAKANGWKVVSNRYHVSFGALELQDTTYQMRLEYTQVSKQADVQVNAIILPVTK